MSIEKLKQIIDENWNLIDDEYKAVWICEDRIALLRKANETSLDGVLVKRPRVFEDGAFYPVILKRQGYEMIAKYNASSRSFYASTCSFKENEFSFIGEKLPASLWEG